MALIILTDKVNHKNQNVIRKCERVSFSGWKEQNLFIEESYYDLSQKSHAGIFPKVKVVHIALFLASLPLTNHSFRPNLIGFLDFKSISEFKNMQVKYNEMRTRTGTKTTFSLWASSWKNKPEFVESSGHGQQDDARIIGFFYVGKKFNLRSTIFSVNVEEFVLDCRCKTLIKVAKPLTPNHSDKV